MNDNTINNPNEPQPQQMSKAELCANALGHYEEISSKCGEHHSIIPDALRAYVKQDLLTYEILRLRMENERLWKQVCGKEREPK